MNESPNGMYRTPNQEEIERLPIRCRVAFAARCARRVQTFIQSRNDQLERLCQLAEGFAANNDSSLRGLELEVRNLASTSPISASLNMMVSDLVEVLLEAKAAEFKDGDDPGYAKADRLVNECCLESDRYGLLNEAVAERDYYRKRNQLLRQANAHRIAQKATGIAEAVISAAIDAGCDDSFISKEMRCDYEALLAAPRGRP